MLFCLPLFYVNNIWRQNTYTLLHQIYTGTNQTQNNKFSVLDFGNQNIMVNRPKLTNRFWWSTIYVNDFM